MNEMYHWHYKKELVQETIIICTKNKKIIAYLYSFNGILQFLPIHQNKKINIVE